jgi:RNA polymerase sigma-70 factor (ECF subfamily)
MASADAASQSSGPSIAAKMSRPSPQAAAVRAESISFSEVYEGYFEFVWRAAANRGIPAGSLDDVAQEVFIVIARKLPEFEGRSSIRTWVAAIVRRVIADFVRKRGNRPSGDESLEHEPAGPVVTSAELERKAAVELLDVLLERMSEEQREVFVLHELEELSGAEIAELTNTNENTVWTRLRAARRIFQEGVSRNRARHEREES